jgi:hypothetical protein
VELKCNCLEKEEIKSAEVQKHTNQNYTVKKLGDIYAEKDRKTRHIKKTKT